MNETLFSSENYKFFDSFITSLNISDLQKDKLKRKQHHPGISNTLKEIQKQQQAGKLQDANALLENLLSNLRDID